MDISYAVRRDNTGCPDKVSLEESKATANISSGAPELIADHPRIVEMLVKGDLIGSYSLSLILLRNKDMGILWRIQRDDGIRGVANSNYYIK